MLLEYLQLEVVGGTATGGIVVVPVDGVNLVAADAQDGAPDGCEGDGRTLEVRGRHDRITQQQQRFLNNSPILVRIRGIGAEELGEKRYDLSGDAVKRERERGTIKLGRTGEVKIRGCPKRGREATWTKHRWAPTGAWPRAVCGEVWGR